MKHTMEHLFIEELRDLLSAEEQIIKALPNVIKAAESPELKDAFRNHLQETKEQVTRLKQIFNILEVKARPEKCEGMAGLIKEASKVIEDYPSSPLRDAALISKAQRIEHYEISAYGTLRTFAKELDLSEVADLLNETLDEEANADKTLSKIAKGGLVTAGINYLAREEED